MFWTFLKVVVLIAFNIYLIVVIWRQKFQSTTEIASRRGTYLILDIKFVNKVVVCLASSCKYCIQIMAENKLRKQFICKL